MIKRMFLFSYLFTLINISAFAQALTQGDTLEIQSKTRFCIRQFEDILNQLAKPDEFFRTYNVDNFISQFYQSTSTDRIFRDSAVLIEDDLHPGSRPPTFEKEKPVKRYLLDFYQFYEKSSGVSVIFSNIQISEVQQGDYLYVNVIYESEFLNRHKYIDTPYTKHKKIATVKAEPGDNGWKAQITFIGFYRTPTLEKEEAVKLEEDEKKQEETIQPIPEDSLQVIEENTGKEGVINVNDAYKRGKQFSISWNENFENPVSLRLYQGDTFKQDLASSITTTQYTGIIPKKAKPGEGYNFQLYNPETKATLESGNFKIRRKIPLGLQIPVYVGAGVLIYFLINGGDDGGGGGDDCPPNCPEPDLPDPVNPYGN